MLNSLYLYDFLYNGEKKKHLNSLIFLSILMILNNTTKFSFVKIISLLLGVVVVLLLL